MRTRRARFLSEALKGANGAVAVLRALERTAPRRAIREEICRRLQRVQRMRRGLQTMEQPGSRYSVSGVATLMGQMLEEMVEVLRIYSSPT